MTGRPQHERWEIVTLFAGRAELLQRWMARFAECVRYIPPDGRGVDPADPPYSRYHWVIDPAVGLEFRQELGRYRQQMLETVHIHQPQEGDLDYQRLDGPLRVHWRVAALLNWLLPQLEDTTDFLLLWEDDIFPQVLTAGILMDAMLQDPEAAAVAAPYLSRHNRVFGRNPTDMSIVVGHLMGGSRQGNLRLSELADKEPRPAGLVGGGYTLYDLTAVRPCLPLAPGLHGGWDTDLCMKLLEHGRKLYLHGGAYVEHRYWLRA